MLYKGRDFNMIDHCMRSVILKLFVESCHVFVVPAPMFEHPSLTASIFL